MITRKKKAKLINYLNTYRKNLEENPDKEIFNIKRKTLDDIIELTIELGYDWNLKKDLLNGYKYKSERDYEVIKNLKTGLDDFKYKVSVLREYFYRCNRAMDYINRNQNKDIIEIDDIANILRGGKVD